MEVVAGQVVDFSVGQPVGEVDGVGGGVVVDAVAEERVHVSRSTRVAGSEVGPCARLLHQFNLISLNLPFEFRELQTP